MNDAPLIAHWPLHGHTRDLAQGLHGVATQAQWVAGPDGTANGAFLGNGRDSVVTVADHAALQLGGQPFTLSAWIKCRTPMRGVYGDLVSKFDRERRCGLNLWVSGSSASYCAMGDSRHVHAGIDDGFLGGWRDCGRPGQGNPLIPCLTALNGELYAGLSDASTPEEAAKVFRWAGGTEWVDCGRLGADPQHLSVMSMIAHQGQLYAGTGIWDWGRAEDARRATPPYALTRVFRYEGGTTWRNLGQVGRGNRVLCMASFEGELYVGLDRGGGGGCFKLVGEQWVSAGNLTERDNFECLMPIGGVLYGASHFAVYRYDGGEQWTCIGRQPHGITQIHSFNALDGQLYIGTWPQGYILRYEGGERWTNTGIVGLATDRPGVAQINEINALGYHHGKLYAGVLPKAQVYRYEKDNQWTLLGSLASSTAFDPKVCPSWRRVLTLATHQGQLFACTGTCQARTWDLEPEQIAGRVWRAQAGLVASHEHDLGGAWTHVAMVRGLKDLRLYINGRLAQRSSLPKGHYLDLGNAEPLLLGRGPQGSFDGALSDLRLNGTALDARAVAALHARQGRVD